MLKTIGTVTVILLAAAAAKAMVRKNVNQWFDDPIRNSRSVRVASDFESAAYGRPDVNDPRFRFPREAPYAGPRQGTETRPAPQDDSLMALKRQRDAACQKYLRTGSRDDYEAYDRIERIFVQAKQSVAARYR